MNEADDVLAHSEDDDEWEDEPAAIEVRPSGKQVLSARIPTELAQRVFDEAARRDTTMSEIVRLAVERYFDPPMFNFIVNVFPGWNIRVFKADPAYDTANPFVTTNTLPPLLTAG